MSKWSEKLSGWSVNNPSTPVNTALVKSRLKQEDAAKGPRALTQDPLAIQSAMGYKDRKYSLTYDILKRIPHQLSIIAGILQVRCNQVAAFSVPYRNSKSVGYQIKHKNPARLTTKGEREFIQDLEKFIYKCGQDDPNPHSARPRDDFETFLKKIVRDSLVFDQSCAVAGSWVELADGTGCPIESIEAGMKVRTHSGAIKEVLYPTQRLYTGDLVTIKLRGQKLTVTSGHPVYAATRTSNKGNSVELSEPRWVPAGELTEDMYLVYPKLSLKNEYSSFPVFAKEPRKYPVGPFDVLVKEVGCHPQTAYQILTGIYPKKGKLEKEVLSCAEKLNVSFVPKRVVEDSTVMDSEWGFLIGLYLAEGNIHNSTTRFTFHEDETYLVDFVRNFGKHYGISSTVIEYEDKQGITVILNSKALSSFLLEMCNTGSSNKKVPAFILSSPEEVRSSLLKGYFLGDGHIRPNSVSFSTISRNLFTGIRALLSSFGIYTSECESNDSYPNHQIQWKGSVSGEAYLALALSWDFPVKTSKNTRRSCIEKGDNLFIKVSEVEKKSVTNKPVYNMEVKDDHSYIMQGFLNHNCFEIVPRVDDLPYEFLAVDASTIRIAAPSVLESPLLGGQTNLYGHNPYKTMIGNSGDITKKPAYVQVINGQIENVFDRTELAFGVRNPRTDIYVQGYGYGELEMLISIITSHLYAEEYNRRFFMQGSAPKGLLNIKGDSMSPDMLEGFKREWRATLEGVENCLSGDTRIYTAEDGFISLAEICGNREEVPVHIWTGESWETGLVYKTKEEKVLCQTVLDTGVVLSSSPDHKFRVIGEEGTPVWKRQFELKEQDVVLLNKENPSLDTELYCLGNKVTTEFMEILGWFLGDGNCSYKTNDRGYSAGATLSWFYNAETELDVLEAHLPVIQRFFPQAYKHTYERSEEQINRIKEKYGFKSVQKTVQSIKLSNVTALRWLESHGFIKHGKKAIPTQLFTMPTEYRAAYLRGVFSADGNNAKRRTPELTCSNDCVRNDIRHLLLSLGVRTSFSEGTSVCNPSSKETKLSSHKLSIKDRDAFFSSIGFIQKAKLPASLKNPNEGNKQDYIPRSTVFKYLSEVRNINKESGYTLLTKRQRMDLNSILSGSDGCSKPRLLKYMRLVNLEVPSWLRNYHTAKIVKTKNTGLYVPMYDVSVDTPEHMFVGDNVLISNSWRTPIFQSEQGLEWIDLHPSNREMEYGQWLEYLIKVATSVFLIDPAELNFDLHGGVQQTPLFESSQEWKLKASRDRGLKPLLRFLAKMLNDNIISRIDDNFVFDFIGLDELTEQEKHELRKEQVASYMTLNEVRRAEDLPDVENGDLILNPTYIQGMQAVQQIEQMKTEAQEAAASSGGQAPEEQPTMEGSGAEDNTPEYADSFSKGNKILEFDFSEFLEVD